jgi:DNA-binding MarR family transcriptional regulator
MTVTIVASFIYYKRIKQAQEEYDGSKDLVRSITSGFTRQLKKLTSNINEIELGASEARRTASEALNMSREAVGAVKEGGQKTKDLAKRVEEADKEITTLKEEMMNLAKRPVTAPIQTMIEAPIPLKQEAVLDNITETELEVLILIEELEEGSGTQIRSKINKTREHTARLLKKLYENGFIDRNTSSMPYRYSIRKEIRELIQERKKRMRLAV